MENRRLSNTYRKKELGKGTQKPAMCKLYIVNIICLNFLTLLLFFAIRTLVNKRPIPFSYPAEFDDGLWGGEAVVKGFQKR